MYKYCWKQLSKQISVFEYAGSAFVYLIPGKLTLLLLNTTCPVLANSVYQDQLASEEANWSGSAMFII